ncbi:radical SAM/SPASM domain-containing protein [Sphingobium sp. Z007]|uniref:radical SAM/SPASM domain-containing protein n=1 Tax=Sphingobium sp. Z007 TaxID=627495 RepID=UPI000B4992F9|nr:radical SAM protein [Sphingobium sp. Z007]
MVEDASIDVRSDESVSNQSMYKIGSVPEGLLYSPLSSCNLNCIQCISKDSRKRAVRMDGRIKEDISRRVEAGEILWMFTDYSGDLLFADKKYPGELDYVLELGIAVHIDTNGVYLTAENIEKIMRSKVDAVSISVDAATDATYRKIRVGSPPVNQIFTAARSLVDARNAHDRKHNFRISMGFTLMRSNIEELPLFVAKAAAAGVDSIGTRHLEIYDVEMEQESLFDDHDLFNAIRIESLKVAEICGINLEIGPPLSSVVEIGGNAPCHIPWTSAVILANGDLQACCSPKSTMGNLHENSMEEIWNSAPYHELRRRVNSASPPSLCNNCQFRNDIGHFQDREGLSSFLRAAPLLQELSA